MVRLQREDFDIGAEIARLTQGRTDIGAVATFTGIYVLGSFTVPYLTGPSAPNLLGVSMQQFFGSFNQPQQAEVMAMIVFVLAAGIGTIYVWANVRASKRASTTT